MRGFVRTWNIHLIRKQPNRPNSIPGRPYILYHHSPDHVSNYGQSISMEKLAELQADVREWG